ALLRAPTAGYATARMRPRGVNEKEAFPPPLVFDCCAVGLLLGMPRGTLRLELLPFGVLLGGEDGGDLLHVRLADLLQLRALRLHHGLQRVELRRAVRVFRRAKL